MCEVHRLVAAQLVAGGGNCEPYRGQDFRASIPVDEGALASRVVAHNHDSDLLGGVSHARPKLRADGLHANLATSLVHLSRVLVTEGGERCVRTLPTEAL